MANFVPVNQLVIQIYLFPLSCNYKSRGVHVLSEKQKKDELWK